MGEKRKRKQFTFNCVCKKHEANESITFGRIYFPVENHHSSDALRTNCAIGSRMIYLLHDAQTA